MQPKSVIIIVLTYLMFMAFVVIGILTSFPPNAAGASDVPEFGCSEKELQVTSKLFATERGYTILDRSEDDGMIILQYGRENDESSFQVLQFCVSKKTGMYFGRAINWFVRKNHKETQKHEQYAYGQLNKAKKAAIEKGFEQVPSSDNDFVLLKDGVAIELAAKVNEKYSMFTILVWNTTLK